MESNAHNQSSTAKVAQESREGEMASGRGMDKGCPWNGLEGLYVYRTEKVLPSGPWRASVKPQSGGKWAWKLELGIINNLS